MIPMLPVYGLLTVTKTYARRRQGKSIELEVNHFTACTDHKTGAYIGPRKYHPAG